MLAVQWMLIHFLQEPIKIINKTHTGNYSKLHLLIKKENEREMLCLLVFPPPLLVYLSELLCLNFCLYQTDIFSTDVEDKDLSDGVRGASGNCSTLI